MRPIHLIVGAYIVLAPLCIAVAAWLWGPVIGFIGRLTVLEFATLAALATAPVVYWLLSKVLREPT